MIQTNSFSNQEHNKMLSLLREALTVDGLKIVGTIATGTLATESTLQLSVWDAIPGNSIEMTYYTGVEAGNPSGTTTNVKTIVYKEGVTTIVTKTLTYNSVDDVLTIVAT